MPSNLSILIIDDDIQICELLTDIFEEHGYAVSTANTGKQALALLQTTSTFSLYQTFYTTKRYNKNALVFNIG